MYFILLISFLSIVSELTLAQTINRQKNHAFSGTLVLTLDGGFTLGKTDYKKSKLGGRLVGGVEYYLSTSSASIFGIRSYFGGQKIYSEEENKIISIQNINNYPAPELIVTDIYLTGADLIYSYSINDKVFPYISAGLSNLWFSPKLANGSRAFRNSNNEYKRQAIAYDFGGGLKYQFNNNISINITGSLHFVNNDNLDDISVGRNKDFYATFTTGLSISFLGNKDNDKDGIENNSDTCPDEPEDYDGFEDVDGCPDLDNDNDNIPDILDKCPVNSEDFDNYMDEDGCPDIDNDGDGILDVGDNCPNEAEDIDGFQDYDGCPDQDNDADGIVDQDDGCPNESEIFNGFEDVDGCPDSVKTTEILSAPEEFTIDGELTFFPGTPDIRKDAYKELERIVKLIRMYPEANWRIEGHTDSYDASNLMIRPLSLRRAETILNYFVSKGLPSYQFQVYNMGDKFPIANNSTEFGRMKNRRVVIVKEK
jgi:outer membrane protein OmpA-like peptidoglycan-associated protein/opacity protein-like surface antigen